LIDVDVSSSKTKGGYGVLVVIALELEGHTNFYATLSKKIGGHTPAWEWRFLAYKYW